MLKLASSRSLVYLSLPGALLASRASATTYLLDRDQTQVFVGGFTELDAIRDSTRSIPESEGNAAIAHSGTAASANPQLALSVRNSRFAVGVSHTDSSGLKGTGYLEFDFFGYETAPADGNSEASFYQSPTMRMRQALLLLEDNSWSLLVGQYWSSFGWQSEYFPSTVSVTAITGTLFERLPQVTLKKSFSLGDEASLQGMFGLERPVQRESQTPNINAGLRLKVMESRVAPYTSSFAEVKPESASLAVSGTVRELVYPQLGPVGRQNHKTVGGLAVDTIIPLIALSKGEAVGNTLALQGEYTKGSGYGDELPNWTGNVAAPNGSTTSIPGQPNIDAGVAGYSYDANHTFTPIRLQTWNTSLQYHFPAGWDSWATAGFGELSSDNATSLIPASNKLTYTQTQTTFLGGIHNFTPAVRLGLELSHYQIRFSDNSTSFDNRVQLASWYRF